MNYDVPDLILWMNYNVPDFILWMNYNVPDLIMWKDLSPSSQSLTAAVSLEGMK